jgi:small GTP-binding protein
MDEVVTRIVLVGDTGVGKTSLFTSYADNAYPADHVTTMGVDFRHVRIRLGTPGSGTPGQGNRVVKMQLWDTAGHERYRSITNTYYRGANMILLVYDVTRRTSFGSLGDWIRTIQDYTDGPIVLVANKVDVDNEYREVNETEGRAFAASHAIPYIEASAKTAYNLTEVFERHVGYLGSLKSMVSTDYVKSITVTPEQVAKKGFWGSC